MAHAFILDFEGATAAQYDAVLEEMDLHGYTAPHSQFHAAGPTATGWRVIDVWDSPEDFQHHAETQIGPITAKHGVGEPRITDFPVAQIRRGGATGIEFMQTVSLAGMDAETFKAMDPKVLKGNANVPHDCVFHINGPLGDGWMVADAWTTKEARDRFVHENIEARDAGSRHGPHARHHRAPGAQHTHARGGDRRLGAAGLHAPRDRHAPTLARASDEADRERAAREAPDRHALDVAPAHAQHALAPVEDVD